MSDSNPRLSELIGKVFGDWTELVAEVLRQARDAGELVVNVPPEVFAKHIVATIEGGIMMSRLSKNGDDLRNCLNSIRAILGIEAKEKLCSQRLMSRNNRESHNIKSRRS
jgi:TetR/AcrR family transcriptional repressor of nem operon